MIFRRLFITLFCIVLLSAAVFAQSSSTESESDKEKRQKEIEQQILKMLNQIVSEGDSLKMARNRAIVYALAGDLYWKFDEKLARELFRKAANDVLVANAEAEKDKKENDDPYAGFFSNDNVREEILPVIAKRDADLALEILTRTRPAALVQAMIKAADPNAKQSDGMFSYDPNTYRVQSEIGLEQRFAVLAAEQNPDKAIKLIKDSLDKGISWNMMPLLQKIYQKDKKKAAGLADDLIKKISDTDLTKKREDLMAAIRFLQYATNPNTPTSRKEKQFKFSDTQLTDLAEKLIETFLQPSKSLNMSMGLMQAISSLEKVLPGKSALLKQKYNEMLSNLPPELKNYQQQMKLWNPNSTPEELLELLPNLKEYEQASAYQSLSSKISKIEDDARAKKLIEQIPDEKSRNNISESYEAEKITRTARAGSLGEAKKLIGNLNKKKTQILRLTSLAAEFYKNGSEESRATAAELMKDAEKLANQYPENSEDMDNLMEIVKGYATVNPEESFRIFEPIVELLNEYVQAAAVMSRYNKYEENFNKGEMLLRANGGSWYSLLLFRYVNHLQALGKADLLRMNLVSDKFSRTDTRIIVKLFIVQGYLAEDKKPEEVENEWMDFY